MGAGLWTTHRLIVGIQFCIRRPSTDAMSEAFPSACMTPSSDTALNVTASSTGNFQSWFASYILGPMGAACVPRVSDHLDHDHSILPPSSVRLSDRGPHWLFTKRAYVTYHYFDSDSMRNRRRPESPTSNFWTTVGSDKMRNDVSSGPRKVRAQGALTALNEELVQILSRCKTTFILARYLTRVPRMLVA